MKKILLLLLALPLFTFGQTISSVEQDVPLFLPEGWSMFGYSCFEQVNVIAAFETITDKVQLVKDYNGNVYMPEYGFNGIGDLESNRGYQIKTSQAITDFQFCPFIVPIVEGCIDLSAFNYNSLANTDDGSCIDVVEGCIDSLSFNYNQLANSEDNSCIAIVYGCADSIADNFNQVANTDDESCIYFGCTDSISCTYIEIANTNDDSCEYPDEGFDCDGNWVTYYPIGDPAFLSWLQSNYPTVIVNDSLDIEVAAAFTNISNFNYTNIENLDGLQYFTNLSYLTIYSNDALTSIPVLSGLTNLSTLDIYNNYVLTSIPELSGLTNLSDLNIQYNYALTSIPELSGLMNLSSLNIRYNDALTSIPELSGLTNLSYLYISYNDALTSIPELSGLTNLSELFIYNNDALTSIPELSGLTNLSYLDIYNNDALECTIGYPEQLNVNSSWPPVCPSACPYDAFLEYSSESYSYDYDACMTPVVNGCMDSIAENYNLEANTEDSSCEYIMGCMDIEADNYNIEATQDDGMCIYYGCIDSTAYNFNLEANTEDGTCIYLGCMDESADNYDSQANQDDESCIYYGCTDSIADNYDSAANTDNETCIYYGCIDESADNYDVDANEDDGTCIYLGCTNHTAENYNSQANQDDGSCVIYGCTFNLFPNYNSVATLDDFSCDILSTDVFGCTTPYYLEYDPFVNQENGSCSVLVVYGCIDSLACNFNPEANITDGTCTYTDQGYDCEGNVTAEIGDLIEGGYLFYIDETGQHGLVAAMEDLEGTYKWGCMNQYVSGADGTGLGTGYQNTLDIVAQNCQTQNGAITAAQATLNYTSEGFTDWYLPSKDELHSIYNNISQNSSVGNIGNISDDTIGAYYWSSTESTSPKAFSLSFNTTDQGPNNKNLSLKVRPIRAIGDWIMGCMDEAACNYNPDANMADGSCAYAEQGYDCDGNITEYVIGMEAEGGIVFYVDESGEHGLVAAIEDLNSEYEWGCFETQLSLFNVTFFGSGLQNTLGIVTECSETPIAASEALAYESEGYTDWYLPSFEELEEMYNTIGNGVSDGNIGGFENNWYWSSSGNLNNDAWAFNFDDGSEYNHYKSNTFLVRVIRAF